MGNAAVYFHHQCSRPSAVCGGGVMSYPQDVAAGANRNPTHPHSPWYIDPYERIESIAQDIISGNHDWSVEDCVTSFIYEDADLLARYKQGLQDVALTPTAGLELHRVIDEAVTLAATKIYEKTQP